MRSTTLLYRQSEIYNHVDVCCRLLSSLEEALQDYVLTDDTPVLVLLLSNKKTERLWTYVRDKSDRQGGRQTR